MTYFTGTLSMVRFILKRDKISLLCWIIILPLLPLGTASAFAGLYPDTAAIQAFAASVNINPAEIAMLGRILSPTLGALVVWRWTAQSVIFLGIFNLFFVIKHTRTEEATGRYELLSSTSIGRYSMLSATFCIAFLANFLIGASITTYLLLYRLPVEGSFVIGVSAWFTGILMATSAAFCAQLRRDAGTAKGMMGVFIVVIYLIKAIGDSTDSWVVWFSPICWVYKMRAYSDENWALLSLFVATILIFMGLSYFLLSKRDIGTGFLKERESRHSTSPYLNNSFALTWKLHKNTIFWWSLSFAGIGAVLGAMMNVLSEQIGTNEAFRDFLAKMGGKNMGDLMFTLTMALCAQALAAYMIAAGAKVQTEEMENRSEMLFSLSISRTKWALQNLLVIFGGIFAILVIFGASSGLCYGLTIGDTYVETIRLLGATLVFLPALCVVGALAFLIFAISPKHFYLSWGFFALMILIGFVRELVPDAAFLTNISPFSYVPQILLGQEVTLSVFWLSCIAVLLSALGIFFYNRRDIG